MTYAYDLETGKRRKQGGLPILNHGMAPCRQSKQRVCPKGSPEEGEITPANKEILEHYLECKAVGQFPDDPSVKFFASLLDVVYRKADDNRQRKHIVDLAKVLLRASKG